MEEIRYYLRDAQSRPIVTVVVQEGVKGIFRGVAICGPLDNPNKKVGYNKAKGRMIQASMNYPFVNQDKINRDDALWRLSCCDVKESVLDNIERYGKIGYVPFEDLNEIERGILKI